MHSISNDTFTEQRILSVQNKSTTLRLPYLVEFDKYTPILPLLNINNPNFVGIITCRLATFKLALLLSFHVILQVLLANAEYKPRG